MRFDSIIKNSSLSIVLLQLFLSNCGGGGGGVGGSNNSLVSVYPAAGSATTNNTNTIPVIPINGGTTGATTGSGASTTSNVPDELMWSLRFANESDTNKTTLISQYTNASTVTCNVNYNAYCSTGLKNFNYISSAANANNWFKRVLRDNKITSNADTTVNNWTATSANSWDSGSVFLGSAKYDINGEQGKGKFEVENYLRNMRSFVYEVSKNIYTYYKNPTNTYDFTTTDATKYSAFNFITSNAAVLSTANSGGNTNSSAMGPFKAPVDRGQDVVVAVVDTGVADIGSFGSNLMKTVEEGNLAVFAGEEETVTNTTIASTTNDDDRPTSGYGYFIFPTKSSASSEFNRGIMYYTRVGNLVNDSGAVQGASVNTTASLQSGYSATTPGSATGYANVNVPNNYYGKNFINYAYTSTSNTATSNPTNFALTSGHGTAMAGIIAGDDTANYLGVANKAKILPVRVLNGVSGSEVGDLLSVAKGIEYISGTFTKSVTGRDNGSNIKSGDTFKDPNNVFTKYSNKDGSGNPYCIEGGVQKLCNTVTTTNFEYDSLNMDINGKKVAIIKKIDAMLTDGTIGKEEMIFERKKSDIINLSLNASWDGTSNGIEYVRSIYTSIINAINKDILVIVSTGNAATGQNGANNPQYPAMFASYKYDKGNSAGNSLGVNTSVSWINDPSNSSYGGLIAVGAVEKFTVSGTGSTVYRLADYSNYCGEAAANCLVAFGGNRTTNDFQVLSDTNNIINNSGTSEATAVVSGVAALIKGMYPYLPMSNIKEVLIRSATPMYDVEYDAAGKATLVAKDLVDDKGNVCDATCTSAVNAGTFVEGGKIVINNTLYYSKKYGAGLVDAYRAAIMPTGILYIGSNISQRTSVVYNNTYWKELQAVKVQSNNSVSGVSEVDNNGNKSIKFDITDINSSYISTNSVLGDSLSNSQFAKDMGTFAFFDEAGRIFNIDFSSKIKSNNNGAVNLYNYLTSNAGFKTVSAPEIFNTRFTANFRNNNEMDFGTLNRKNFTIDKTKDYNRYNMRSYKFSSNPIANLTIDSEVGGGSVNFVSKTISAESNITKFELFTNPLSDQYIGLINNFNTNSLSNTPSRNNFATGNARYAIGKYFTIDANLTQSQIANNFNTTTSSNSQDLSKAKLGFVALNVKPNQNSIVSVKFGELSESASLMGGYSSGMIKLADNSKTRYMTASVIHKFLKNFELFTNFTNGTTNASNSGVGLISGISQVETRGYAVGLSAKDFKLFNKYSSGFGVIYSEPLRISKGSITYLSSNGDAITGNITTEYKNASLTPSGRERDIEIFYNISNGRNVNLSFNFLNKIEPNHIKNAKTESVSMMKFNSNW